MHINTEQLPLLHYPIPVFLSFFLSFLPQKHFYFIFASLAFSSTQETRFPPLKWSPISLKNPSPPTNLTSTKLTTLTSNSSIISRSYRRFKTNSRRLPPCLSLFPFPFFHSLLSACIYHSKLILYLPFLNFNVIFIDGYATSIAFLLLFLISFSSCFFNWT